MDLQGEHSQEPMICKTNNQILAGNWPDIADLYVRLITRRQRAALPSIGWFLILLDFELEQTHFMRCYILGNDNNLNSLNVPKNDLEIATLSLRLGFREGQGKLYQAANMERDILFTASRHPL